MDRIRNMDMDRGEERDSEGICGNPWRDQPKKKETISQMHKTEWSSLFFCVLSTQGHLWQYTKQYESKATTVPQNLISTANDECASTRQKNPQGWKVHWLLGSHNTNHTQINSHTCQFVTVTTAARPRTRRTQFHILIGKSTIHGFQTPNQSVMQQCVCALPWVLSQVPTTCTGTATSLL